MIIGNPRKIDNNLLFFVIAFFASSFIFVGINNLGKNIEDYVFFREVAKNPEIFKAQVNLDNILEERARKKNAENKPLELSAKSVVSVLFSPDSGGETIVFEKDSDAVLPIASLTKLMLADVVLENYDLNKIIKISDKAVSQEGEMGNLKVGEELSVENLLYITLIESSNDAAYALSEALPPDVLVRLMNLEAKYLGMANTNFYDPMGISAQNQSTGKDLVILIKHLLNDEPLVWEILKKSEYELKSPDGVLHHKLFNTNEILREWGSNLEIVGGKTGYTFQANGCFALVLKVADNGYLINVILGSDDRFGEMKQLVDWLAANSKL